jgi:hypothetical protein
MVKIPGVKFSQSTPWRSTMEWQEYEPGLTVDSNAEPLASIPTLVPSQLEYVAQSHQGLGHLGNLACLYLGAESRLGMAGNSPSFNPSTQPPQNSAQILYLDRELEQAVARMVERAFGYPLTVNRYGGSEISLHLGKVHTEETPPPGTSEYRTEIAALPQLQEQGDGVRAFVGSLLSILTTRYPIVLVDEPEAFLHPPQAYLLGRFLATQHDVGTQVIVATHSADFIAGVTATKAAANHVSIIRLTREGTSNYTAQISPSIVGELFRDPLVRYYNILGGLFTEGAIVCESESDCTYYRAVLESLEASEADELPVQPSIHFTHCSGKSRMPKAVEALAAAKVPTACMVDIDFLQDEVGFVELIRACGGNSEVVGAQRNVVADAVKSQGSPIKRSLAQVQVSGVFESSTATDLTTNEAKRIKEAVTPRSGWREFKRSGTSLLSGQAVTAFTEMDKYLRSVGIFIVFVGELERFHPEIPSANKAAWLREVLESEKYSNSATARNLVRTQCVQCVAAPMKYRPAEVGRGAGRADSCGRHKWSRWNQLIPLSARNPRIA